MCVCVCEWMAEQGESSKHWLQQEAGSSGESWLPILWKDMIYKWWGNETTLFKCSSVMFFIMHILWRIENLLAEKNKVENITQKKTVFQKNKRGYLISTCYVQVPNAIVRNSLCGRLHNITSEKSTKILPFAVSESLMSKNITKNSYNMQERGENWGTK